LAFASLTNSCGSNRLIARGMYLKSSPDKEDISLRLSTEIFPYRHHCCHSQSDADFADFRKEAPLRVPSLLMPCSQHTGFSQNASPIWFPHCPTWSVITTRYWFFDCSVGLQYTALETCADLLPFSPEYIEALSCNPTMQQTEALNVGGNSWPLKHDAKKVKLVFYLRSLRATENRWPRWLRGLLGESVDSWHGTRASSTTCDTDTKTHRPQKLQNI
jgi:hypothetical protein